MPEVFMPRLSDTMEEGELTTWRKKVGDQIHKGDVLAEIETDKATMDLEAFEEGTLEEILVEEGTLVPIGQAVAIIGDGSAPSEKSEPTEPAAEEAEPDTEEPAAETAQPAAEEEPAGEPQHTEAQRSEVQESDAARPRTSPLARKIARENNIELDTLTGTGPQGRIVRADVEEAIAAAKTKAPAQAEQAQGEQAPLAPVPATSTSTAEDTVIPLSRVRRITAKRLTESQAVPHFFLTSVVDVEKLVAFRADINAELASAGIKVSINDLIVRACAVTLRNHPAVNSSFQDDSLLHHQRINVGIAVALEDGLVVPVVADADQKTLSSIAAETVALAGRAREGKLSLSEMSGGTFTISNLGMFGIDQFTAVINPPEAAILAVGAATPEPVLRDGALVNVPKMKITLTADHRVLDGATAAAFLRDVTAILQEPLRIVL
ncbi:MAG: dihydrolipoamide acetyltransferase family protein [Microbacteriaceae bacterium]